MIILHKAPQGAELITNGTERFNLIMKDYPLRITVSKQQMAKYWKKNDKLPGYLQKRLDTGEVEWAEKKVTRGGVRTTISCLWDIQASEWLVKNKKIVGTEKSKPINAQTFWSSGPGAQWERQKMQEQLFSYFTACITRQLPEAIWAPKESFIQFEFLFFIATETFKHIEHIQDIDNHAYPYVKTFIDTLKTLTVIKGDDIRFVRGYYPRYIDIPATEQRRMEVKIHFCRNEEPILPRIYRIDVPTVDRIDESVRAEEDVL